MFCQNIGPDGKPCGGMIIRGECGACKNQKKRQEKPTLEELLTKNRHTHEIVKALKKEGIKNIARWYDHVRNDAGAMYGTLVCEDGLVVREVITHPFALDLTANVPDKGYAVLSHVQFLSTEHLKGEQNYWFQVSGRYSMTIKAARTQRELRAPKIFATSLASYVLFPKEYDCKDIL